MLIVAGLGNPGVRYRNTRHNAGFMVADQVAAKLKTDFAREKYHALMAEAAFKGERVLLIKPLTFMNISGDSVARAVRYNNVDLIDLLVMVDDVNLALGRLRLRAEGSAGGHNGLKSIIQHLGSDQFPRLRIGVGHNKGSELRDHVLGKFAPDEKALMEEAVSRAADSVLCFLEFGIEQAMNEYNRGVAPE